MWSTFSKKSTKITKSTKSFVKKDATCPKEDRDMIEKEDKAEAFSIEAARLAASKAGSYHKDLMNWLCDTVEKLEEELEIEREVKHSIGKIGFYTEIEFDGCKQDFPECADVVASDKTIEALTQEFEDALKKALLAAPGRYSFGGCGVKLSVNFEEAEEV